MEYLGYGHVRPTCFPSEDRGSLLPLTENSIRDKVEQRCQFAQICVFRLEKVRGPKFEDLGAILLGHSAPYSSRNFCGTAPDHTAHSYARSLKEPRDEAKRMALLV
jgi:hypothetical protein